LSALQFREIVLFSLRVEMSRATEEFDAKRWVRFDDRERGVREGSR
jgi:hypothetical protein